MIDLNDFKRFETTSNGKTIFNKKYMGHCIQCKGPRGISKGARYSGPYRKEV